MEKDCNDINKDSKNKYEKTNIDSFIEKITNNFTIKNIIKIKGKVLHFLSEENENSDIINFSFYIFGDTEINPFLIDIVIDLELVPNKIPYARIRRDFILPSLYDNRNYYYCLTNEHDYIYDPKKLEILEKILKEMTNSGIENFLFCLKENLEIKTFVYFGEYELHSIYNINDFLENNKLIKFYRVNQILEKGKEIEERYIIVTQLYILIFKPTKKDKSFAELIFMKYLRNISFNYKKSFNKKLNSNTLILYIQDIKTPNGITYEMEFTLINRSRPPITIMEDELDEEEEEIKDNTNINNNNDKNKNNVNNNTSDSNNHNNANNANNSNNSNNLNNLNNVIKKEEDDIWDKYYQFEEEIEKKQKEINFSKYKLIIESYRPLFNHRSNDDKKVNGIQFKNKIMDYEKMFQHCEKIYNYYEKMKDNKKYKQRMEYYIVNINFFCAELMGFFDLEKASFKFYFDKMKYYLNLNETNQ